VTAEAAVRRQHLQCSWVCEHTFYRALQLTRSIPARSRREHLRLSLCDASELTKLASQHSAFEKGWAPGWRERRQLGRLAEVARVPIDARSSRDQRTKPQARSALVTLVDLERERALHQLGPRPIPAAMGRRAFVVGGVRVCAFDLVFVRKRWHDE
jgi:hypothetical protein